MRGHGSLSFALLGIDTESKELLKEIANITCPATDSALHHLIKRSRLHIIPEYSNTEHLPYVKAMSMDAVLVFGKGPPHSVIFNAGDYTPKLFDEKEFDHSLEK